MTAELQNWKKNIYLFLFGQFLSGITSFVVQYAIIWFLAEQSGSATMLSFATLLGMLPTIVLSPFVGPIVDRFNKKQLLIVTDIVVAIVAIILSITGTMLATIPFWLVFVSLFVRAVAQTFQMPIIQSILPTMVPENELTKVNGKLGMVMAANFIIAPGLGAFLFSLIPMNYLILTDVVGAIFGIGLLLFIAIPKVISQGEKVHFMTDTKFGLTKIMEKKGLWYFLLINAAMMIFFMPAISMYPLMVMGYFGGTVAQAGIVEMVYAIGMLVGGSVIGFFGKWKNRMSLVIIAYFILGISMGLSGIVPNNNQGFLLFLWLNGAAGIVSPFFSTLSMAIIQQSFEPQHLGRVLGIYNSLSSLTAPIGLIFAGPVADRIGVENLFVVAGVATLICSVAILAIPSVRNYDKELQLTLDKEA